MSALYDLKKPVSSASRQPTGFLLWSGLCRIITDVSTETFPIDPRGHENPPLIANVLSGSNGSSLPEHIITQLEVAEARLEFSGRLVIPDQPFNIPEQDFIATFSDFGATFENKPVELWPRIFIEFSSDEPLGGSQVKEFFKRLTDLKVKSFLVQPSSNPVDAEILYTRVMYCLHKSGECYLIATNFGRLFGIGLGPILRAEEQQLLYRAKLYRKLKFIQNVFRVQFTIPQSISADEVSTIDSIFRGITEGEFITRSSEGTFTDITPSEIDLTQPPFDGIGRFSRKIGNKVSLFGKNLDVGPITVSLQKAELADPNVVRQIRSGSTQPIDVRFAVLDNQVIHRFESYARQPRKRLLQRLNRFKQQLAREEPPELVNLVTESLQRDVSSEEALQIAMGWTQYNELPDRYCPQEPEIDSATGHWRVPVWLVYTSGEGGPVGEIIIDKKTGVIINHTPIEEMRSRALSLSNEYDEEVLATARKFMDRHDKLLRRLAE